MFSLFRSNPIKKLEKQHLQLVEMATHCQQKGYVRTYAELTSEAEEIREKIQQMKREELWREAKSIS